MSIKLVIASLLLGTSTLAVAAPGDYTGAPADDCEPDGAPAGYGSPSSYGYGGDHGPGNGGYVPTSYPTPASYPTSYPSQPGYPSQYPQPGYSQYPSQYQPARWDHERRHRPVTLASDLQLEGRGRRFIAVGPQAGRFARLELKAQQGRTFIKQVYVQFDDGQEQVIRDIDRTLSRRNGLTLDLDGGRRTIRRIVVYGEGQRRGWNVGTLSVVAS